MSDAFDQLALVAEISAALLGFIAVFLVLSNQDGKFAESDRHFIQALIVSGSLAVFWALTPRALSFFMPADAMWAKALWISLLSGVAAAGVQAHAQLSMSRAEAAQIHWGWHVIAWGMGIGSFSMFALGLLGVVGAAGAYVAGVSIIAVLALWSFISVVFRRFF